MIANNYTEQGKVSVYLTRVIKAIAQQQNFIQLKIGEKIKSIGVDIYYSRFLYLRKRLKVILFGVID